MPVSLRRSIANYRHRAVAICTILTVWAAGPAAQTFDREAPVPTRWAGLSFALRGPISPLVLQPTDWGLPTRRAVDQATPAAGAKQSASAGSDLAKDIALAAAGVAGGFFAGAFIGDGLDRYVIEGNHCGCDDPGLVGVIWGSIIGAIALPIILVHFFG